MQLTMRFHGRGKNKIQNPDNLSEIYDAYIKEFENQSPYDVSRTTFIDVNDKFYTRVVEEILDGKTFNMPFGVGRILVEKRKAKAFRTSKRFIDWKTTMEVGQVVYHLNEHTNGYNYFIRWYKDAVIKNCKKYRFIPTRAFRRTLAQIIKSKSLDYFER